MDENSLPLRPSNESPVNPDVEPLLRSIFQEFLETPQYPENIARNLKKNRLECSDTKDSAVKALEIIEENLLSLNSIQKVEEKLMVSKAKYLLHEAEIRDNLLEKKKRLLTKDPLYQNIDIKDITKYNLIKKTDLWPNYLKRCTDFTFNFNLHNCNPCLSNISLEKEKKIKYEVNNDSQDVKIDLNYENISTKGVAFVDVLMRQNNTFKVNTEVVIFEDYHVNVIYKKKVKIQNISNKSQMLRIEEYPKSKFFKVYLEDENAFFKIPPGMSVEVSIKFQTDIYLDVQDSFAIKSGSMDDSEELRVKLASYRESPHLCLNIANGQPSFDLNSAYFDVSRSIALNNTIDCGSIFIGTKKTLHLIVMNCGGPGSFFLISEEHWLQNYIHDLNLFLQMKINNFMLSPLYFEIKTDEFIVITVEFCAKIKGLNTEKFWILCDNITFEILDLIADGISFDKYIIQIEGDDLHPKDYLANIFSNHDVKNCENGNCEEEYTTTAYTSDDDNFLPTNLCSSENTAARKESYTNVSSPTQENMSDTILGYLLTNMITEEEEMNLVKRKQFVLVFDVFPFKNYCQTIRVLNDCPIALAPKWNFTCCSYLETIPEYKKLNCECIKIDDKVLLPYQKTEFPINLNVDVLDPGFYCINLNFYISSIPKMAVNLNDFIFLEKENDMVDLLISQITIICNVKEVSIEIFPDTIEIKRELSLNETFEEFFKVKVLMDDELISGSWFVENLDRIEVEPSKFTCTSQTYIEFKLILRNNSWEDFNETIVLIINNVFKKTLKVTGRTKKPYLRADETFYDFGIIEVNNIYSKKLKFYGETLENFEWVLSEEENEEDFKSNTAELLCTTFENGDVEFEYKINAMEEITWTTTYILKSYYKKELTNTTKIMFKFVISELIVLLHTAFSQCPIICPDDVLLINQPQKFLLCFHNLSSINTVFCFGDHWGDQSQDLKIEISTKSGFLRGLSCYRVDLEVLPLKVGIIKEVFVTCHFQNTHPDLCGDYNPVESIKLSLLCLVENITVQVNIPISDISNDENLKEENEKVFLWPPRLKTGDLSLFGSSENDLVKEDNKDSNQILVLEEKGSNNNIEDIIGKEEEKKISFPEDKAFKVDFNENETNKSSFDIPDKSNRSTINDISEYLQQIINTAFEDSENCKSSYETLPGCCSIQTFLGDEFTLQENILEFHNVPARTMIKKTIKITNLTPLCADLSTAVKNFPPTLVESSKIDEILFSLKIKSHEDKFEKLVSEMGICIILENELDFLESYQTLKIDIYVYANTWGVYYDELCIKIGDVLPLYISLLIEIRGIPLEFPICPNHTGNNTLRHSILKNFSTYLLWVREYLEKYFICRLGVLSCKSDPISRKVYIKNISNIPFTVIWHVFMEGEDLKEQPFQILFDVYHPDVERSLSQKMSFGAFNIIGSNLKIMNNSNIFKLESSETYLKPQSTSWVEVTFKPEPYVNSFFKSEIKAYLMGYLYLDESYGKKVNVFKRKQGSELKGIKMKLMGSLELPRLKLASVDSDVEFVLFATELSEFVTSNEVEIKKRILFKNCNNCPVYLCAKAEKPVTVQSLITIRYKVDNIHDEYNCVVAYPEEIVEVNVLLKLTKKDIRDVTDMLFASDRNSEDVSIWRNYSFKNNCLYLQRYLKIHQKSFKNQKIPMEIKIFFPDIQVPSKLDFGLVFIGNNKKEFLTIKNFTACPVHFEILFDLEDFAVTPVEGLLSPSKAGRPTLFDVSVIFMPSIFKSYMEEIRINVGTFEKTVIVLGTSTHNERKYVPNSY